MKQCSSCGKPALFGIGDVYLCVDCNFKLEQAQQMRFQRDAALLNYLAGQAEAVTGLYGTQPRIQIPQVTSQQGSVTFNNIIMNESIAGSINQAQLQAVDATVSDIKMGGNDDLANHLKDFTQAVLDIKELDKQLREELIEALSFISSQFHARENMRRPSIIRVTLKRIGEIVDTVKALAPLWLPLLPEIQEYFQL